MEGAFGVSVDGGLPVLGDEEARWVALARKGDAQAFKKLVQRHQSAVLSLALRMGCDLGEARDVAQEVFLSFWKERARYEHQGKLRAYLLQTARFRCLDRQKKAESSKATRRALALVAVEPSDDAERRMEEREAGARLRKALAKLDLGRGEVLRLRYLDGRSLEEIAELTGSPVGTVKSRLFRGLSDLRKELTDVE